MTNKSAVVLALLLAVWVFGATAETQMPGELTRAKGYFGEPLDELSNEQLEAFNRGFELFVRRWSGDPAARNAESCVSCHSMPMPGGAGASIETFVSVQTLNEKSVILHGETEPGLSNVEVRRPPPLFGLGLLEFSDGLPGVATLGAYGGTSSLLEFVSAAFAFELGVPTPFHCPQIQSCLPQITKSELLDVIAYVRLLAPPPGADERSSHGRNLFAAAGCARCHLPERSTDADAPPGLQGRAFAPYTDQIGHNLGADYAAVTPPLWGVNSVGPPYWHDGSAPSLLEAIRAHGGDASNSRDSFFQMSADDQGSLLNFLRSL